MIQTFALAIALFLPQAWAIFADKSAAWRVAILAVSLAAATAGLASFLNNGVTLSTPADGAYQDTYYVIGQLHYLVSLIVVLSVLAALLAYADAPKTALAKGGAVGGEPSGPSWDSIDPLSGSDMADHADATALH